MKLDARKLQILQAIINDYIMTAEPVGSRTLAKKYGLGISSATIRNEMSDLEEMGFLEQPHTSAGRVPSDKAYRLYVDKLMQVRSLDEQEAEYIKETYETRILQIEQIIFHTAKILSEITNYTSIAMAPAEQGNDPAYSTGAGRRRVCTVGDRYELRHPQGYVDPYSRRDRQRLSLQDIQHIE